jgi:hypothetical protein
MNAPEPIVKGLETQHVRPRVLIIGAGFAGLWAARALARSPVEVLGWVTILGGRVEMTAEGRQFLAADINTRKQRLNATLRGLFAFDLILQMLKLSTNNEVDEAVVLSQLALTFPHERPLRLLRTVVAWARYAALFNYSTTRRVLHGPREPATPTR